MPRKSDRNDYVQRINRVIDHVHANLDGDLSLDALARVSGFSPYHFHRIFGSVAGERVNDFVKRIRLERAVGLLRASPDAHLSRIAYDSGFSSLSDFSRSFKQQFGFSPSAWDRSSRLEKSKIGQAGDPIPCYVSLDRNDNDEVMVEDLHATVRSFAECAIAYVRVADPCAKGALADGYEALRRWLDERGVAIERGGLIGISPDDPDATPPELLRYDLCAILREELRGEGAIGVRRMPACSVVAVRCRGGLDAVTEAWEYLYRHWLPRSRYEPANLPAMEIYLRLPEEIGWELYDIECCIPIVPL